MIAELYIDEEDKIIESNKLSKEDIILVKRRAGSSHQYDAWDIEGSIMYGHFKENPTPEELAIMCKRIYQDAFEHGKKCGEGSMQQKIRNLIGIKEVI